MSLQRWEKYALPLFLLAVLGLATLYNITSTPFDAPDEIGHYYYVRHLLIERTLPVIPDPASFPHYAQEGTQGPFYYLGAALFAQALQKPLGLTFETSAAPFEFNPHSTCGQRQARYNVAALARDPRQEAFPYAGRVRVLHTLRLWSTLLAVGTIAGIFVGTRYLFPQQPLTAWFAALLTAGMPEFLFMAGSINNDNMITLLATWGLTLMLHLHQTGLRRWHAPVLGLLSGLAALTKASGLLLWPLACAAIGLAYWQSQNPRLEVHKENLKTLWPKLVALLKAVWLPWMVVTLTFLATAGWWFARNWHLYGDPTATLGHLSVMPVRTATMTWGIFFQELPGLFLSWWGVFGCTMPPDAFYALAGLLTLGGLWGVYRGRAELKPRCIPIGLLLLWLAMMGVAYLRWNWLVHGAKGRLLYPTLLTCHGLLGWGWSYWATRWPWLKRAFPAGLLLLAVGIPLGVMRPRVALPPIYADAAAVHIPYPLEGRFGEEIALRGYALNRNSLAPGQTLDLTLYWAVEQRPAQHYSLALQLVSAIPGETATLLNFNTWTGGGNYPTGYWQPGEVIVDHFRLTLPEEVARAQAWWLQAVLYETETGARLPWIIAGNPVSDYAPLHLVRVGASGPAPLPPAGDLAAPVTFQDAIQLRALTLAPAADQVQVTVWWASLTPLPANYTVFVHLLDAAGNPVANADAPPLSGGFPTSLWQPGDSISDTYTLPRPDPRAAYTLKLGWYDPQTGWRLEAVQDGNLLPDAALSLNLPPASE